MEGDGSMERGQRCCWRCPRNREQEKGLNLFLLSHPSTSCQYLPLAESPRSQRTTETGKLRSLCYRAGQENEREWAESEPSLNIRVCLFIIHFNVFKFFFFFFTF